MQDRVSDQEAAFQGEGYSRDATSTIERNGGQGAPDESRDEPTLSSGDPPSETDTQAEPETTNASEADAGTGDDADLPGAEGADTDSDTEATSDGNDEAGDGDFVQYTALEEVPEEHKDRKYVGTWSVYDDDEAILQGVEEKDQELNKRKQRIETLQNERSEREKQLQARLDLYESRMPEDEFRDALVQEKLPENFVGKGVSDFADEAEQEAFIEARLEARKEVDKEIEERLNAPAVRDEQWAKSLEEAQPVIEKFFDPEFFGATNPEEKELMAEVLSDNSPKDGDIVEMTQYATATFDPVLAELVAEGLRARLNKKRRERAGGITKTVRDNETTRDTKRHDDGEKPRTTTTDYSSMSGRDMMQSAREEMMQQR